MKNKAEYKGIEFAKGYNKTLNEFIEEFGDTHVFKNMRPEDREIAFVEAHKIATDGNLKGVQAESGKAK